jgi:hypothetical protein
MNLKLGRAWSILMQTKAAAFVAETTHDVAPHPAAKPTPAAG